MNMSLQIGRSVFAIGLLAVAGAGAFAQTGVDADAQAPNVAHSRLEILSSAQPQETPRWVVASVRVGTPEQARAVHLTVPCDSACAPMRGVLHTLHVAAEPQLRCQAIHTA